MEKPRLPEIDWLKGFAILCVIINHSGAANGTWLYDHVVARAVPVFLVLFGMNAEFWWSKRARSPIVGRLREWFTGRFQRLMVPYWGAITVWWVLVFIYGQGIPRTPTFMAASYGGYVPWVSTYWFVTLILECVVMYPVIRWAILRLGDRRSLVIALLVTLGSAGYYLDVIHWGEKLLRHSSPNPHSYFWIFFPAYLWHIVAGAVLARRPGLRSPAAAGVAAVVYLVVVWARSHVEPGRLALAAQLLGDVPLAVALLAGMNALRSWPAPAALLTWCGNASWGLYLGHVLTHEAFNLFGLKPDWSSSIDRWMYAGALLVSGIGFVTFGQALRQPRIADWIPGLVSRGSSGATESGNRFTLPR